ncbi:unnamed protein product, partial [Prorocentrum cordatum]
AAEAADGAAFLRKVCERENSEVRLAVYNIRSHAFREVGVTPRKWAGEGLLGAVLRYDALDEFVDAYAISVQSVASNSPAETAGLIPLKDFDFPLGTAEVMFRNIDDVSEIVSGCKWKNTTLYVYNSDSESVREVTIMPFTGWGGDDCLGADMRPVALHKIPAPRQSQAMASGLPPAPRAQLLARLRSRAQPWAAVRVAMPDEKATGRVLLPDAVLPSRYDLRLAPDLERFVFDGKARITVDVREATSDVVMHAFELQVSSVKFVPAEGEAIAAVSLAQNLKEKTLTATFEEVLPVGAGVVEVEYTGILNDQMA